MSDLRISPALLEAYLAHTGWNLAGSLEDINADVWHRPDDEYAEVILPLDESIDDFAERLADALSAIAKFEQRDTATVADRVRAIDADVVRVRVVHHDVEDGSIPLDEGVALNERARDMMLAAAISSVHRKKIFLGTRPDLAATYMKSLRLGQTSVGSYVVNVIAPVKRKSDELDSRPFARVVTENLFNALLSLNAAAERYLREENLEVFDATVEAGVSSNLCEAVLGMGGASHQRKVEVSIVPAPSVATQVEAQTVGFDSKHLNAIGAAADYLKGDYILMDRTIRGYVKRLDRERGDETGTVSITTVLLGKKEKHVSVTLPPESYAEAIKAHEQGYAVEVHGNIHVTPRTATMLNATGFRVLKNDELF